MPSCSWPRVLAFLTVYVPVWASAFAPRPPCDAFRLRDRRAALSCCSTKGGATTTAAQDWTGVLPFLPPERFRSASPAESLREGEWFKLICGASFEDLPAVRNLALVYTLAGADCIDVAADEAVIEAARDGMLAARGVAEAIGVPLRAPWLMMSVNDDEEDPHFRKAVFDPSLCPSDCPRPCESICPADAIVFPDSAAPPPQRAAMVAELLETSAGGGVLGPRCYGCGRCIDVCPPGIIEAQKYMRSPQVIRELLEKVEAVEIHTKGNVEHFRVLWEESIAAAAEQSLRLVAVSFPDLGAGTGLTIAAMNSIMGIDGSAEEGGRGGWESMEGGGAATEGRATRALNVWQTDGRPMSGDIGTGATTACIRLAEKVLATQVLPFGEGQHYVQLAGGTNARTAPKLRELELIGGHPQVQPRQKQQHQEQRSRSKAHVGVGGVAYGGYARKAVGRALDRLPGGPNDGGGRVEDFPEVLSAAVEEASLLLGGLKRP